jgi:hypothetical protein
VNSFSGKKSSQQGAALILLAAVLVLGVGWYTVRALNTAAPATSEREVRSGVALQAAKQALLAYVAQYAARSGTADPGQMPCPESLTLASPGVSSASCSATALVVGRLPWKTLGIDQLRDGYGEPLWYMMRGFRDPPINFGTAGQLSYNGSAVVALIIAPGRPLNTSADAGTPPAGCAKLDQTAATRNLPTLNAANFLECGVATGSIVIPGDSAWTNDRAIAITAEEWADAVAPAVADRMQRQLAPALEDWRASESVTVWGTSFLPYASTFGDPTVNDLCGDTGIREGLAPFAPSSQSGCPRFTGASSLVAGLISLGCTQSATSADCSFMRLFGSAPFSARVTATALAAAGFRQRITAADVSVSDGGSVTSFSMSYNAASGVATATVDATWPITLGIFQTVTVSVPHLPDAAWLSDARVAWFVSNEWARYTYYGVSQAATTNPGASVCNPGGTVTDCLTVNGMAPADKRLVLVLTGRALAGQTRPSTNPADYLEGIAALPPAASNASVGDRSYTTGTVMSDFNDRVAACPFQQTPASGTPVTICN